MKNKKIHNNTSTGFKTPEGYFDAFENNFIDKISTEESELNVTSSGFETPKGYFDNLEDRITQNISDKKEPKVISLINKKTVVYISSIAAAVLLLFNLSIFESKPSFNNLETEAVENFIISDDISSYEIAALMSEDLLNENDFIDLSLDEKNIEEYLLQNADIESLMIE